MAGHSRAGGKWLTVLLLVAALAVWAYDQNGSLGPDPKPTTTRRGKDSSTPTRSQKAGDYEVYRGCALVENRQNDGDSFLVRLPTGRQAIFRLYFVDTPESAFRSYANGETNHQRIGEQAQALGGITTENAVKIGQQAKRLTLDLLASQPFTIYTRWDSPFHDGRYHAHIDVNQGSGPPRWLDEILVGNGYARIHTKGAAMPDGTPQEEHRTRLKALEATAKKTAVGAWGISP